MASHSQSSNGDTGPNAAMPPRTPVPAQPPVGAFSTPDNFHQQQPLSSWQSPPGQAPPPQQQSWAMPPRNAPYFMPQQQPQYGYSQPPPPQQWYGTPPPPPQAYQGMQSPQSHNGPYRYNQMREGPSSRGPPPPYHGIGQHMSPMTPTGPMHPGQGMRPYMHISPQTLAKRKYGDIGGRPRGGPITPGARSEAVLANKRITSSRTPQDILNVFGSSWKDFDTVCMATAMHRLGKLDVGRDAYDYLAHQPDFIRLLTMIGERLQEFTARNLSNTVYALAIMQINPGDALLTALAAEAVKKIGGFIAQNLSNIVWAFSTLEWNPGPTFLATLAKEAEKKLHEFTPQNMSNTVMAFARLEYDPGALLPALAAEAHKKLPDFSPQALSNTVWALSKLALESRDSVLLDAVAAAMLPVLPEFNAQNIANTIWAYATFGYTPNPSSLIDELAMAAMKVMPTFSCQNISNTMWALAKLEHSCPELMDAAMQHVLRLGTEYTPQSDANMLWACATMKFPPTDIFLGTVLGHALNHLKDFTPQNLANITWSIATLALPVLKCKMFLEAVSDEVARRLKSDEATGTQWSRQHLANLLWAFATLDLHPGARMMSAVVEALVVRAADCNPQEVSNAIWAIAKLNEYAAPLIEALTSEARSRIAEFSQQNLSNLAYACGRLGHLDGPLLATIADRAVAQMQDLSLQHITNVSWAYASLGVVAPRLTAALRTEVMRRLEAEQLSAQQLCNLLWALALLRELDLKMWTAMLAQFGSLERPSSELAPEALMQVHQARLLLEMEFTGADLAKDAPDGLLSAAEDVWIESAKQVTISDFHRDVSTTLHAMSIEHDMEALTEDGAFSVDVLMHKDRIALEVDGPHHWLANSRAPTGETLGRRRLLAARGWAVVSVPYFEWPTGGLQDKEDYLQAALDDGRRRQLDIAAALLSPQPGGPAPAILNGAVPRVLSEEGIIRDPQDGHIITLAAPWRTGAQITQSTTPITVRPQIVSEIRPQIVSESLEPPPGADSVADHLTLETPSVLTSPEGGVAPKDGIQPDHLGDVVPVQVKLTATDSGEEGDALQQAKARVLALANELVKSAAKATD